MSPARSLESTILSRIGKCRRSPLQVIEARSTLDGWSSSEPKRKNSADTTVHLSLILAFAFSPDLQHVAVVSNDGSLRIIDFNHERLLDTFSAYFGALSCVCWSPDGKYVLVWGRYLFNIRRTGLLHFTQLLTFSLHVFTGCF